MLISTIIDGKVLDWSFKKFEYGYNFYIGDKLYGQIFKQSTGWSAVPYEKSLGFPVDGFKTRYTAANFIKELTLNAKLRGFECT